MDCNPVNTTNNNQYIFRPWEWAILTLILVIVITLIILLVYYFVYLDKGQGFGQACSQNTDCRSGLYCSGNYTCQEGTAQKQGQSCQNDSFCAVGLVCQQNVCVISFNLEFEPLPSFTQQNLIENIDGVPYYLTIANNSSYLAKPQSFTFSYNSNSGKLLYNNSNVVVNSSGYLQTSTGVGDIFKLVIDSNNNITLRDKNNNILLRTQNSTNNQFLAFFFNVSDYPNSTIHSNVVTKQVNLIVQEIEI